MKRNYYIYLILVFLSFSTLVSAQLNTCTINAGVNGEWCFGSTIMLDGNIGGEAEVGTLLWEQVSGPTIVTILNANQLQATVKTNVPGTYVFRLKTNCSLGKTEQTVSHVLQSPANPIAGKDTLVACYRGGSIPLRGLNSPPAGFAAVWVVLEGRGIVVDNELIPDTFAVDYCGANGADFKLMYVFNNELGCNYFDTVNVRVVNYIPPVFIKSHCTDPPTAYSSCPGQYGTGKWIFVSPPGGNGATFSNPTGTNTQLLNLLKDVPYVIKFQVNNPCITNPDGSNTEDSNLDTILCRPYVGGGGPCVVTKARITNLNQFQTVSDKDNATYISFCGTPDSVILFGSIPKFDEQESFTWNLNPFACDIWAFIPGAPYIAPNVSPIGTTGVLLRNLQPGNYGLDYVIVAANGCKDSIRVYVQILPNGKDINYHASNMCGNVDLSYQNIGARADYDLSVINTRNYWHYPIPKDLVPIIVAGTPYSLKSDANYKPINLPNAPSWLSIGDHAWNATFHEQQYFFNIQKGAPSGTYIYELPLVYGGNQTPSCNGAKATFIFDLSIPPTVANAGTDLYACKDNTTLAGNTVSSPQWKLVKKIPANVPDPTIVGADTKSPALTNLVADAEFWYQYKSDGGIECPSSYDTVVLRTSNAPPPQPDAGADRLNICYGSEITLSATPLISPIGTKGNWEVTKQIPDGVSPIFSDASKPNTSVQNLVPNTTYTFKYTLKGGCGEKSDSMVVSMSNTQGAPPPYAGPDQCLRTGQAVLLQAATSGQAGVISKWSVFSGNPTSSTILNPDSAVTKVVGLIEGTYKYIWESGRAGCGTAVDTVVITIGGSPTANIVNPQVYICNSALPVNVGLKADSSVGYWTQIDGVPVNIGNINNPVTTVSNLNVGYYSFRWRVENGACSGIADQEIFVGRPTPIAEAGLDQTICGGADSIVLNATPADSLTTYWTIEPLAPNVPSAGVDFVGGTTLNMPNAIIKLKPGKTRLRWNITSGAPCGGSPSVDDIILEYVPAATLDRDTLKLCGDTYCSLVSNSPFASGVGTWTQLDGPIINGLPRITDNNNPVLLKLTGDAAIYRLRYEITSKVCKTTNDTLVLINYAPPVSFEIPNDTLCTRDQLLLGGYPLPDGYSATWDLIASSVTIPNPIFSPSKTSPTVTFSPVLPGQYLFQYTITNGGCTYIESFVDSIKASTVDAGADRVLCSGDTYKLPDAGSGRRWIAPSQNPSNASVDPFTGLVQGMDAKGQYHFMLAEISGKDTCFDLVKITKNNVYSIQKQPDTVRLCENGVGNLQIVAKAAEGSVQYQWQRADALNGSYLPVASGIDSIYKVISSAPGIGYYRVILSNTANACLDTSRAVPVTVYDAPKFTLEPKNKDICDKDSVQLLAQLTGGVSPIQYSWQQSSSVGGPWIDIAGANAAMYNFKVATGVSYYRLVAASANNICADLSSTVVKVDAAQVTALIENPKSVICSGDSVVLVAAGGLNYTWSNGGNTSAIQVKPIAATKYAVSVSDARGCKDTISTFVGVNPLPMLTVKALAAEICQGNSAAIDATGTGSFLWSTGSTAAGITPQPSTTTTYFVTLTDQNGCKSIASQAINVVKDVVVSAVASKQEICEGDVLSLTASGTVGTYSWSNGTIGNTISVSPKSNTTYSVTVSTNIGCTATSDVSIQVNPKPRPIIELTPSKPGNAYCVGDSIQMLASGGSTYNWSNGANSPVIQVKPLVSTKYSVLVADSKGCKDTISSFVQVNPLPSLTIKAVASDICLGNKASISATGVGSFLWNSGEVSNTIMPQPSSNTTYSVTLTDLNGCKSTAAQAISVTKDVNVVAVGSKQEICEGDTVTLTASGTAGTYTWSNGKVGNSILVDPKSNAGYAVTVTTGIGCTATSVVSVVVNPKPVTSLTILNPKPNNAYCVGDTIQLKASGASAYTFRDPEGLITNNGSGLLTINNLSTAKSGQFEVLVIDGKQCTAKAFQSITVGALPQSTLLGADTFCLGGSTTLVLSVPSDASFFWSDNSSEKIRVVAPTIAGIQTYTATVVGQNGCKLVSSVDVKVLPIPTQITILNTQPICKDSSRLLEVSAVGGNSYQWSTGSPSNQKQVLIKPTSSSSFTVTVFNTDGCSATSKASIEVHEPPIAVVSATSLQVCKDSLVLTGNSAPGYIGKWSNNEGGNWSQSMDSLRVFGLNSGANQFYYTVTSSTCPGSAVDSVFIWKANQQPLAKDDDRYVLMNEAVDIVVFLNDSINHVKNLAWQFIEGSNGTWSMDGKTGVVSFKPELNLLGNASAKYKIWNADCPDYFSLAVVKIKVDGPRLGGDDAELITPNGDGKNEGFTLDYLDRFPDNELTIFNRWGSEVYRAKPYKNSDPWIGTNNSGGELPEGTYYYYLSYQSPTDGKKSVYGSILLLR